ncbi:hypothetical protein O3P69_005356 [Scylla paramamosain]|uniref:Uncharacterized protein n=1 Tax=Scylla paramamosain TaxID=85552 RepID=A0AAW0UBB5_SCYPA
MVTIKYTRGSWRGREGEGGRVWEAEGRTGHSAPKLNFHNQCTQTLGRDIPGSSITLAGRGGCRGHMVDEMRKALYENDLSDLPSLQILMFASLIFTQILQEEISMPPHGASECIAVQQVALTANLTHASGTAGRAGAGVGGGNNGVSSKGGWGPRGAEKVPRPCPQRPPPPNAQPPTTPRQSSHIHGAVLLLAAQHYGEEINTRRGSRAELAAGTTTKDEEEEEIDDDDDDEDKNRGEDSRNSAQPRVVKAGHDELHTPLRHITPSLPAVSPASLNPAGGREAGRHFKKTDGQQAIGSRIEGLRPDSSTEIEGGSPLVQK